MAAINSLASDLIPPGPLAQWQGLIQAALGTPAPPAAAVAPQAAVPSPAPQTTAPAAPQAAPQASAPMPSQPALHPVRNAILGLLAGGPAGLFQQLQQNEASKVNLARMQSVYASLPDEYKPLFVADPQGFLASYMKNIEPQKLGEGDMAVLGGGRTRILNAKKIIDEKSGKPVYMTETGPVAFDSLGGDVSAKDGLIISGRTGESREYNAPGQYKADNGLLYDSRTGQYRTYSTPQKLQMGETPGAFTPTVVSPAQAVVADLIRQRAKAAGLDDASTEALVRTGQLESSLNPSAPNNGSSTGPFQFHPDTFARLGGKDIRNTDQQIDAAIRLQQNNAAALHAANLPVNPTTLYLSHQQGIVGTRALLEADPGVPAAQVLASVYAHQYGLQKGMRMAELAVTKNGGKPNMTAGQFVSMWNDRVGGVKPPASAGHGADVSAQAAQIGSPAPGWTVGQPTGMSGGAPGSASGLTGEDFLKTLPAGYGATVRQMAKGELAMPSGFVMKTPYGQKLINDIMQYDPSANAVNLPTRVATRKAFTSGPQGRNLANLNTVVNHLASLHDAIDGLRNFSGIGTTLNKPANILAGATDPDYQRARAKFDDARGIVSADLVSALTGGGGALHDREFWMKQFDPDNSPDSLHAAAQQAAEMIESRVQPMRDSYQQGMGTTEDPFQVMFPHGAAALERLRAGSAPAKAASPAAAPTAHASAAAEPIATGPGGHQIVYRNGAWRDPKSGAAVH